jgi:hypothetical protein
MADARTGGSSTATDSNADHGNIGGTGTSAGGFARTDSADRLCDQPNALDVPRIPGDTTIGVARGTVAPGDVVGTCATASTTAHHSPAGHRTGCQIDGASAGGARSAKDDSA